LKLNPGIRDFLGGWVAPCAGAWIETCPLYPCAEQEPVAPCAGAWIET